ncbi:MAG: hypothetical protein RXO43_02190 [Candidatus Micrarchaeota archaeon]
MYEKLGLGSLFARLRAALITFTRSLDEIIDENKKISMDDINELRKHIQHKLENNEDIEDNKKLRELLELFATDKAVFEVIRKDASSWINMLDAIIINLSNKKELTDEERKELSELIGLANQLSALLRKEVKESDQDHAFS